MTRKIPHSSLACRAVRRRLPLLAGQDLAAGEARRVWDHLGTCLACRQAFRGHRAAREALRSLQPSPVEPGSTAAAFFERLSSNTLEALAGAPPTQGGRRWRAVGVGAALFLLGLVAAVAGWIDLRGGRPGSGMLQRPSLDPGPFEMRSSRQQLAYPQGLEAQRQLRLLFEEEAEPQRPR